MKKYLKNFGYCNMRMPDKNFKYIIRNMYIILAREGVWLVAFTSLL